MVWHSLRAHTGLMISPARGQNARSRINMFRTIHIFGLELSSFGRGHHMPEPQLTWSHMHKTVLGPAILLLLLVMPIPKCRPSTMMAFIFIIRMLFSLAGIQPDPFVIKVSRWPKCHISTHTHTQHTLAAVLTNMPHGQYTIYLLRGGVNEHFSLDI